MSAIARSRDRSAVFVMSGRLLAYPDDELVQSLPLVRELVASLTDRSCAALFDTAVAALGSRPLLELQQDYVSTFDLKRRCCLYLSYYLNGDTRRRGMALWRFQETYRLGGFAVLGGELPDFLPVLLEFGAEGGDAEAAALSLLEEHRQGIEVLLAALERHGSIYAGVVAAVAATLPTLTSAQRAAAELLVAQGPPAEQVGLEPFNLTDITVGART